MSIPKNLAITFDPIEVEKAIEENAKKIAETVVIQDMFDQVYEKGKSIGHKEKGYVNAHKGAEGVNRVRFK